MVKILFICHGNICRSPMAEFVFKDMVSRCGLADQFYIASAGTSAEETGNPVHPGTRRKLASHGISAANKTAVQLIKNDHDKYDYFIGMDSHNITNMQRILGNDESGSIRRLLDFTDTPRDIADPWYSGNFDQTYDDVLEGCKALVQYIFADQVDLMTFQ